MQPFFSPFVGGRRRRKSIVSGFDGFDGHLLLLDRSGAGADDECVQPSPGWPFNVLAFAGGQQKVEEALGSKFTTRGPTRVEWLANAGVGLGWAVAADY